MSAAGVLTSTLIGATETVMAGGGAMMLADVVKVCTGPLTVPPKLVSVADSELIGMVKVPVLPGNPVATTLTVIVQLPLGGMVGVGNAVIVICVGTLRSTKAGQLLEMGAGPTTAKFTSGNGVLVLRLATTEDAAKLETLMVSTAFPPADTFPGVKLAVGNSCACACVASNPNIITATLCDASAKPRLQR